jgi:phospholipid/cholesterol/gamma-HCH transport system substrate-binding protein
VRRHKPRVSNFLAGMIGAGVIAVACYLVFGGGLPFGSSPFVLKAVFTHQIQLHIPSPVRIAGVDVGQIVGVQRIPNSNAAVVTMDIEDKALPIHADATVQLRSRIFLEGNFYADLRAGSPGAPTLDSGATLSATRTSGPVQLDRVLAALNANARENLQTLLQGLGGSFDTVGSPAANATQDPIVRNQTGGQALNTSLNYSADAFEASAIVNQALLGTQPRDLSKAVIGSARLFRGLAESPDQLASLITTFNATLAAFAARQNDLSQTIAVLPPLLRAIDSSDTALDASFAPTKAFAKAILPGVIQSGPTISAALPWIAQATALVSPSELGGLLDALTPAVQQTATSLNATKALIQTADTLANCFTHNIVPAGNEQIQDPPDTTGLKVYQELFQSAVGLAGGSSNFDGNGRYLRASPAGGNIRTKSASLPGIGPLLGNAVLQPLGTRPAYPGKAPPLRRDVACVKNAVPNLNNVRTGGTP